jgi:hypothetical protein
MVFIRSKDPFVIRPSLMVLSVIWLHNIYKVVVKKSYPSQAARGVLILIDASQKWLLLWVGFIYTRY